MINRMIFGFLVCGLTALSASVQASAGSKLEKATRDSRQVSSTPDAHNLTSQRKAVVIPTQGMTCMSCVGQIKTVLRKVDGVKDVEVNLASRFVRVEYVEGKVFPELLAAEITKLGYKTGKPAVEGSK